MELHESEQGVEQHFFKNECLMSVTVGFFRKIFIKGKLIFVLQISIIYYIFLYLHFLYIIYLYIKYLIRRLF